MKTYWKYWFAGFLALILAAGVGCSSAKSPTSQNAADANVSEKKPDQQAASASPAQGSPQASNLQESRSASETMPKTASPLVWIGLGGVTTLLTGVTLRIVRNWRSRVHAALGHDDSAQ